MNKTEETKTKKPKREYEDDIEMGDKFDVIKQAIKVNSEISTLNADFIMSDLSITSMTNPASKYVRKQLSIIEMLDVYLDEDGDEEGKKQIKQIMLNDIFSLVNLSRAEKAKVINAILKYIENGGGEAITTTTGTEPTEKQEENFFQRINPFKQKKTEA